MDIPTAVLNLIVFGATTLTNIFKGEQSNSNSPATGLNVTKVIMGGHNAAIEDYPYQVYYRFLEEYWWLYCSGFIVSERYVLTAAHCVFRTKPKHIRLRVGSSWRLGGRLTPIAEIIVHPKYDEDTLDCDVAVLKTTKPIKFSKQIQPVKLPYKGKPLQENAALDVAGWGATGVSDSYEADYLQAIVVPVVNKKMCKDIFEELSENMFCAGFYDSDTKDACCGDSGGAAVHDGEAVGIVSFGVPCNESDTVYPAGYTYVAAPAVRDFIKQHTGL